MGAGELLVWHEKRLGVACHVLAVYMFPSRSQPSTLIRHENGAFRKRSSNQRNLKTRAFRFSVDGKHF